MNFHITSGERRIPTFLSCAHNSILNLIIQSVMVLSFLHVYEHHEISRMKVCFFLFYSIYIYIVMVCRYLWHDCPTLLNCLLFNLLQSRFSCMLLFFSLRILIGFLATFRRSPAFRCNFIRTTEQCSVFGTMTGQLVLRTWNEYEEINDISLSFELFC